MNLGSYQRQLLMTEIGYCWAATLAKKGSSGNCNIETTKYFSTAAINAKTKLTVLISYQDINYYKALFVRRDPTEELMPTISHHR